KYIKYNFIFGFCLSIFLFLIKPFLLGWAGPNYIENGSNSYNVMLVAIIFYCLNSAFGSYWTSINKAYIGLLSNFIWAIVVVLLSYILIGQFQNGQTIFLALALGYFCIF